MAKKKVLYECQACGFQTPRWIGKCTNCGEWDSIIELSSEQIKFLDETKKEMGGVSKAQSIISITKENISRVSSGSKELDLVLGGGIVDGSLTLIGGSPGIGKSTLLLKTAGNLAKTSKKVLYVSGEESPGQIKLRADRLGALDENLFLLCEINLSAILNEIHANSYNFIVII